MNEETLLCEAICPYQHMKSGAVFYELPLWSLSNLPQTELSHADLNRLLFVFSLIFLLVSSHFNDTLCCT